MQYAIAALAGLSAVAYARPQGVTAQLTPPGAPICSPSYSGGFQISVVNVTSAPAKRAVNPNDLPGNALILTLQNGVLKDQDGRTGYIAANRQFQFDDPPQTGAIWTSGFSVCPNNTLALTSTVFYQCYTGGFYNLYDRPAESSCSGIYFQTLPSSPDGELAPLPVPVPSAQATASTIAPATQVTDGQVQGPTSVSIAPVTQITDGQPQAPTHVVVTQITDGQVQAPTAPVVTQITDGQVQAPTSPVVSQITDGQVQAPTAPVVTQITDGQVQAPTSPVVSQITDGQVQAPTTPLAPVTQISDGQVQAPTNATVPPPYTGAAVSVSGGNYMAVAVGAVFLGAILL